MRWSRGPVQVTRVGGALWLEAHGRGVLVDAPPGTATALGDRLARVESVVLTNGRIERVSGVVSVLGALRAPDPELPLTVRFPLTDERGALLVEAWQRAWPDREVTLDGVGPGEPFELVSAEVHTEALSDPGGEPPPIGLRFTWEGVIVAVLPRCRLDGAARRLGRGAHLLVVEPGGLSTGQAVELAGAAELWVEASVEA